jgi:hypothetical protein
MAMYGKASGVRRERRFVEVLTFRGAILATTLLAVANSVNDACAKYVAGGRR